MSITVITEPKVFLVGTQQVDEAALDRFLGSEGVEGWSTDAEVGGQKLVEVAGRVCYMSFARPRPGGNKAYIDHILDVGHGSVLEHAVFNLVITGVSRSLSHELVRHRAGFGFSQLSQRYVDESDVAFVVPPAFLKGKEIYDRWMETANLGDGEPSLFDRLPNEQKALVSAYVMWHCQCETALGAYRMIADFASTAIGVVTDARKRAREAARSVLPNCAETKIFVTGNARAWRHFVEIRGDGGAEAEIRRLAVKVVDVLADAAPGLFGDYSVVGERGDFPTVHTDHRKV